MTSFFAAEARDLADAYDSDLSEIYDKIKEMAKHGAYKLTIVVPQDKCYRIENNLKEKGYEVETDGDPRYCDPEIIISW